MEDRTVLEVEFLGDEGTEDLLSRRGGGAGGEQGSDLQGPGMLPPPPHL